MSTPIGGEVVYRSCLLNVIRSDVTGRYGAAVRNGDGSLQTMVPSIYATPDEALWYARQAVDIYFETQADYLYWGSGG